MKYCFILFFIIFSTAVSAQQKWTVISTFPVNPVPCFYNETYGFVLSYSNDEPALYRTTNGGKNWNLINVVAVLDKSPTPIYLSNVYLYTSNHLFGSDANNLYESIDSGLTWKPIWLDYASNSFYVHDGTIYSGDGTYSIDDGKTRIKDLPSFWGGTYSIIGNKENGIACFSGGIQNLDNGTLFTTDGGQSWAIGEHKDFGTGYAIPYTLTYFRVCPNLRVAPPYPKNMPILDSNIILRSTNGGATWQKIFPGNAETYSLESVITGSGTVLFAQQTSKYALPFDNKGGVLRSVNFGVTWDTIGGPRNIENGRCGMSAVARGAICFAGDGSGNLWKFVDSSLLRNATWDLNLNRFSSSISHDTLFAKTCDSVRLTINYGFHGSDYVKLDEINVEGLSSSEYRADFIKNKVIMAGRQDTSSITFFPLLPGTYPIKIHSFIMRDDWVREDTAFTLTLIVKPNPAMLYLIGKRKIDFSSQTLCVAKVAKDSFSVVNIGCDSLEVKSITLEVDQDPKTDFSFTPQQSFNVFRADPERKFFISYKPTAVGFATGRIIIITNAATDTINLQGEGLRDRTIISFSPDTLRAITGNSVVAYLPLTNLGCRLVDLDSLQAQSVLNFPISQFFLPLTSGEIENIKVLFSPQQKGLSTIAVKAFLRVLSERDTIAFDTTFSVTVEGLNSDQVSVSPVPSTPLASDIIINSLYPDPAQDEIFINIQSQIEQIAKIEILNTLGIEVYSGSTNLNPGSNSVRIILQGLPKGEYLFKIITSKGKTSGSFIKIQ